MSLVDWDDPRTANHLAHWRRVARQVEARERAQREASRQKPELDR